MLRVFIVLLLGIFFLPSSSHAQLKLPEGKSITWGELSDISWTTSKKERAEGIYGVPIFGEMLQTRQGQEVIIEGYMLPISVDNQRFILSQYSFSDCFFCGAAGKETVMELQLKEIKKFPIDEPIKIKGKLELVDSPNELCYRLVEAEWVR